MRLSSKRFLALAAIGFSISSIPTGAQTPQASAAGPDLNFPTVLYGAAYYNEYMPATTQTMLHGSPRTWP